MKNKKEKSMWKIKILFAAVTMLALSCVALPRPASAQTEMIDGQVTKIDVPAGKIAIRHGPIKKFDMDDGMTMVFRVSDSAMLTAVKVGDKVKFEADRVNGQFTVTKIQKVK
jgi:Cu/Ag efflux protein CusF